MKPQKLVIIIEGGIVQSMFSTKPIDVVIIDKDVENQDDIDCEVTIVSSKELDNIIEEEIG